MKKLLTTLFGISAICADAQIPDPTKVFLSNGWEKITDLMIPSASGDQKAHSYSKNINGINIYGTYLSDSSIVWFGKNNDRCVFLNHKLLWIGWNQPTHFVFSDFSSSIKTQDDLTASIKNAEDRLIREPREIVKIRQYKGAFGLIGSGENGTRDLNFGIMRTLKTFRFKGENLELTLSGSPSDVAIIELAPNLDYVSSSVNGEGIDPRIVEVRKIRTDREYREYLDAKYGLRKSEPSKTNHPKSGEPIPKQDPLKPSPDMK
jgi:hypothetical protein